MHVVFRESHGLEETETPFDLGQTPADLVVLSFSDSDLGAFAAGFHRARRMGNIAHPTVRLANLVALKHPLSVDTYVDQTLSHARGILIRLIGGESYWPYGLAQVAGPRPPQGDCARRPARRRARGCAARRAVDLADLDAAPSSASVRSGRRGCGPSRAATTLAGGRPLRRPGDRRKDRAGLRLLPARARRCRISTPPRT